MLWFKYRLWHYTELGSFGSSAFTIRVALSKSGKLSEPQHHLEKWITNIHLIRLLRIRNTVFRVISKGLATLSKPSIIQMATGPEAGRRGGPAFSCGDRWQQDVWYILGHTSCGIFSSYLPVLSSSLVLFPGTFPVLVWD